MFDSNNIVNNPNDHTGALAAIIASSNRGRLIAINANKSPNQSKDDSFVIYIYTGTITQIAQSSDYKDFYYVHAMTLNGKESYLVHKDKIQDILDAINPTTPIK